MQFMKQLTAATLALGTVALLGGAANAQTVITPGGVPVITPIAGPFGGTVVESLVNQPILNGSFNGQTITGTVTSVVVTGGTVDQALGFGGTSLDFYYQITSSGSNASITAANFASFIGFNTAVSQVADGDVGANTFFTAGTAQSNFSSRTGDGEGVTFNFSGVPNNTTTYTLIVRTNATQRVTSSVGVNGSGVGGSAAALAPTLVAQAPEPGSVALLGVGFAGMVGMIARRRKTA